MKKIILQLGSNKGDRAQYLAKARELIGLHVGPVTEASNIYETSAWGLEEQDDFYNQIIISSTHLNAHDLMRRLQKIEAIIGKAKEIFWGPRNIDIDILFYGTGIVDTEMLQIPHPRLSERRFVLVPLAEIADEFIHPVTDQTIQEILENCTDKGRVEIVKEESIIE